MMMKRRQKSNGGRNLADNSTSSCVSVLPRATTTNDSPPPPSPQVVNNNTNDKPKRRHGSKIRTLDPCILLLVLFLGVCGTNIVYRHVKKRRNMTRTSPESRGAIPATAVDTVFFPHEPNLTKGCSVKFRYANMSLCYFLPYGANFGDELGPATVRRLLEYHFGCSATANDVHVIDMASANPGLRRENRTCLFALGSIFHYVRTGDHVWGTGINPTHQGSTHPDWLHVHSVRGPETARKLKEWYDMTDVPQGDPGFLIPTLYQEYYHLPTKSIGVEPAYTQPRFCFVPHAHDLEMDFIKHPPPDLRIISVKQHWRPMMEAVRMCDFVVSTSLHGIVVADALGIPSKWFQFANSTTQKTEGSFKYHDYLWSIGRTDQDHPDRTVSMAAIKRTSTYMRPIPEGRRKELVQKFMSSFPYHLFRKSLTPLEATHVRTDCHVHFKDKDMSLCVLSSGGGFVGTIGIDVVRRLLENRFGCSAAQLPITGVKERTTKCLLTQSLDHAVAGDFVWGAGATADDKNLRKVASKLDIRSVRGPDTASALKKRFSSPVHVPFGDPGFLLPFINRDVLANTSSSNGSSARFCYIPGEADDEEDISGELPSGVSLISTKLPSIQALESLQRCDFVVSSSMNGMILADSLGIPTKWFERRAELNLFGLKDYFLSTDRTMGNIETSFEKVVDRHGYVTPLSRDDRESFAEQTAATFPFDLFESRQNQTLVIIMGSIRGGERAWESLYKNVLDLNSADLALVVGEQDPVNRTSSLYKRAKYLYEFPEFEDWADAIDLINGTAWRDDLLAYASTEDGLFGAADGRQGSGAVIFMARWYVQKAIEDYGLLDCYDRFVVTRSDHFYGCKHDLSVLDSSYMWVPQGQDFGRITDRHLVANSQQIMKALDIYPNPVRYSSKYVDSTWFHRNPEQLIARRWKEENLWDQTRRFDRVMFTCADAGDQTRWQGRSEQKSEEGVYLKYVVEYNQTKCVCSGRRWKGNDTASLCSGSNRADRTREIAR